MNCYIYIQNDNNRYDYFYYINSNNKLQQYEPNSDMDFVIFKQLKKLIIIKNKIINKLKWKLILNVLVIKMVVIIAF